MSHIRTCMLLGSTSMGLALSSTAATAQDGAVDAATLVIVLVLAFSLYAPILAMIGVMELTRMAEASFTRIRRLLDTEPMALPREPTTPQSTTLTFEGVDFAYVPNQPVLQDISFTVPPKTMTAIVGPSGSGKSTVLNLIPRFWDVAAGRVTLGGQDLRDLDEQTLSNHITMVFQDVYLFAGSIADNIRMGQPEADDTAVQNAARQAQAHDFIMALPDSYDTQVGEGGASLSGGEAQRLSIARAILKDAPIVLLDEATAAIDPTTERALQPAFARLVENKTLIVVAHKLSTIEAADQILVLSDGKIAERGNHATLIQQNGIYAGLWQQRKQAQSRQISA